MEHMLHQQAYSQWYKQYRQSYLCIVNNLELLYHMECKIRLQDQDKSQQDMWMRHKGPVSRFWEALLQLNHEQEGGQRRIQIETSLFVMNNFTICFYTRPDQYRPLQTLYAALLYIYYQITQPLNII
eukprot:TRINITY_DN2465_c0_g2_i3.p4 TRINITY_DN2465_c0_g2~~TRINITY_DN2465_c0_g2_i3.p4  ORF type:complete len:127 (-),score=0.88 TRINITY_DN2465_c0_g2_i3:155-535(-)